MSEFIENKDTGTASKPGILADKLFSTRVMVDNSHTDMCVYWNVDSSKW